MFLSQPYANKNFIVASASTSIASTTGRRVKAGSSKLDFLCLRVYHLPVHLTTHRAILRPTPPKEPLMPDEPIAVGQPAPDFSLASTAEKSPLSLSDLRGKVVVLAFYVLDFTDT